MPGAPDEKIIIMRHVHTLDFRGELLEEEEDTPVRRHRCPTVQISIEDKSLMALADSGSQVSCISESYYEDNAHTFKNCPTLPVVATSVVGATGGRPVKLKKQIFVTLKIGELECKTIFLIIPELTKNCVLGVDVLRTMGRLINLRDGTLTLNQESKTATIKMYEEESPEDPRANPGEVRLLETYEELTEEQLQSKIESGETMPQAMKRKYKDLLWKYREIFITKPGRIDCYYHRLTLTDGHPPCPRTYPVPYNSSPRTGTLTKSFSWLCQKRTGGEA